MTKGTYTIQQVLSEAGVSARAFREWIRVKVMPRPLGKGRGARYDESHLMRARAIAHLRSRRLSLNAIRAKLRNMSDEQIAALVPPRPRAASPEGVPVPPPVPEYPASTWEVIELARGLNLLVNTHGGELLRRVAADIYRHYGMTGSP